MLYVFYGTDSIRARARAEQVREALHKKRPDALYRVVEEADATPELLDELLAGQGLFERKYIVLFRAVLQGDFRDALAGALTQLAESDHVFLVVEEVIPKPLLKKLTRVARDVREYAKPGRTHKEPSLFALADALARRDKRGLWVGFQEARMRGVAPEEVHGVLLWQLKSIQRARAGGSAQESGLSPFVFQKAKRAHALFSEEEIAQSASALVRLYHDARRGGVFETALERFILTM